MHFVTVCGTGVSLGHVRRMTYSRPFPKPPSMRHKRSRRRLERKKENDVNINEPFSSKFFSSANYASIRSLDLLHFDAIPRRVCYFGIHVFPGTSLEIRSSLSGRFDVLNVRPPIFLHPRSSPPVSSPRKRARARAHTQVLLSDRFSCYRSPFLPLRKGGALEGRI